jgi:prepilin signal peptidase PulO-like enzyme (type II secretory pathway)
MLICFALGAFVGSVANLAIYRFAWEPRDLSPWSPPRKGVTRNWYDRLPIFGWLAMRREVPVYGAGFWIRPLAIELFTATAFAALYWWEVHAGGLLLDPVLWQEEFSLLLAVEVDERLFHKQVLAHWILFSFLVVATFIDIDDQIIPDQVTIPGTILGLGLATVLPASLLAGRAVLTPALPLTVQTVVDPLLITMPGEWPSWLEGGPPNWTALLIGFACFWVWCFALLPRVWYSRFGSRKALRYFVATILRERSSKFIFVIWVVGSIVIGLTWRNGGVSWAGLLSSLVGMTGGVLMIWSVRIIGQVVLKKEAMGFGDVTLMGMIGAFVCWQGGLIVFFLAPLAGLFIAVIQFLLTRNQLIPYGPFLCVATAITVVFWRPIWGFMGVRYDAMGIWMPVILASCLAAMALMLAALQFVKRLIRSA